MLKRTALLCIVIILCLVIGLTCFAEENDLIQYLEEAQKLQELGLFNGTLNGFELERVPKKVEAGVMLIRLLGKEDEVKTGTYKHPFQDVPSWADAYIGYMYENGLTKGINTNEFGSNLDVKTNTFITFILRALEYDDTKGDFNWSTATDTALEKNILSQEEINNLKDTQFLRDDMVNISYKALGTYMNESSQTLADKLISENVIDPTLSISFGLVNESQEGRHMITYEVIKKDGGLYYNLSGEQLPEEFRKDYSNISSRSGNGQYPTFTEEQIYVLLKPTYNYPIKFTGGEEKIYDDGYHIISYYDKKGNIIGYVDFSYISKEGTYTREFHVWDKDKEKEYKGKYYDYIDSMMKNAKALNDSIVQYYFYDDDVRIYYDFEKVFGSEISTIYVRTGTSNNYTAYDHTIGELRRKYVFGIDLKAYNDVVGTDLYANNLLENCCVCFFDENGILGYLKFDDKPKSSADNVYEITIERTVNIEEGGLTYDNFEKLEIDVYIDNELVYKVTGATLYDINGAILSDHFDVELDEVKEEKSLSYSYNIGIFHFRGKDIDIKLSGPDSNQYHVSW